MKRWWPGIMLLVALSALLPQAVLAHAPLSGDQNDTMGTAVVIPDPAKSWAIYSELHEAGEFQFYRFEIKKDERIFVSLIKSTAEEDAGFIPNMALLGPGLPRQDVLTEAITVPDWMGWRVIPGQPALQATYEAFSPGSFYDMASLDTAAPEEGNYYVVVFSGTGGGRYGLAVGYQESFTIVEWLTIPINAVSIHLWQGENWAYILGPILIPLAVGIAWLWWRSRKYFPPRTYFEWSGAVAGVLFGSAAISFATQVGLAVFSSHLTWEIGISAAFVIIPAVLAYVTLRTVLRSVT
jgi:hypothetical protein